MGLLSKDPEYENIQFVYSEVSKMIDDAAVKDNKKPPHYAMQKARGISQQADCPFCGRRAKLGLKLDTNQYNCPACHAHGNSLTLFATVAQLDTKAAKKELKRVYNGLPSEAKAVYVERAAAAKAEQDKEWPAAQLFLRNYVYKELLDQLELSEKHRKALKKRGLTDAEIDASLFRTYPCIGLKSIADECSTLYESASLWIDTKGKANEEERLGGAIPGFYRDEKDGRWTLVERGSPMLSPVVTLDGQISFFETRVNNLPRNATEEQRKKFRRYERLASGGMFCGCGTNGLENIHHAGFAPIPDMIIDESGNMTAPEIITPETVTLTEGSLKATVASILLGGKPFIAVLGVNNQSQLPAELKYLHEHGTKQINLAFDMDYQTNDNVKDSLQKAINSIHEAGMTVNQLTWPEKYKGVDDWLAARRRMREE